MSGAAHHRGPHKRIAKQIVLAAYANAMTRCWQCHNTLDQCGPRADGRNRNGTRCTWQAGHVVDGDSRFGYQAECSYCNASRGAQLLNTRRGYRGVVRPSSWGEPHSERWS